MPKMNMNTDSQTDDKGERAKQYSVAILVNQDEKERYYDGMPNRAGTVKGLVERLSILAEVAYYSLLIDKGYKKWEIALVLVVLGGGLGSWEGYASNIPMGTEGDVERLWGRLDEDEFHWRILREYCSCVGKGRPLTDTLSEAYAERYDMDVLWHQGSVPGGRYRVAQRSRAGWWDRPREELVGLLERGSWDDGVRED